VASLKYLLLIPVSMRTRAAARNHVIGVLVGCIDAGNCRYRV